MQKPRVLLVHNYYQQSGGEDVVFDSEKKLLEERGHTVFEYTDTNFRLQSLNRIAAARETIWSDHSYQKIRQKIVQNKPDVVHFHNTFLLISPAAYYACRELGIPIVQTLHNYRLICPSAIFYRNGGVCEDCLGKAFPWPGVLHKCYRGSHLQSLVVAAMLAYHRMIHTWSEIVDVFISLTEFGRNKMIEANLPSHKIFVKPNFVNREDVPRVGAGNHAIFIGRLTPEKGLNTLVKAWSFFDQIPLKILGNGVLHDEIEQNLPRAGFIELLGFQDRNSVFNLMNNSRFLVFPSEWYEGFPVAIAESFACGLPVIASRLGAMVELVTDGETGLLFEPGNAADLARKVQWLWSNPQESIRMGHNARKEYEDKYTPQRNYELLMSIYEKVADRTIR
jgi:glycosyltransferase involved in cell wall biosynthesis